MTTFMFKHAIGELCDPSSTTLLYWDDESQDTIKVMVLDVAIPRSEADSQHLDDITPAFSRAGETDDADDQELATRYKWDTSDTDPANYFMQLGAADVTFASLGSTTDSPVVALLLYQQAGVSYDEAADSPICHIDFSAQPDGNDLLIQWARVAHSGAAISGAGTVIRVS